MNDNNKEAFSVFFLGRRDDLSDWVKKIILSHVGSHIFVFIISLWNMDVIRFWCGQMFIMGEVLGKEHTEI